jgi:hypothetical protein
MKLLFTIGLDNRHSSDADLLQSFVADAVRNFAKCTNSRADVERVRMCADDFDPFESFRNDRHGRTRFAGTYARQGKPS